MRISREKKAMHIWGVGVGGETKRDDNCHLFRVHGGYIWKKLSGVGVTKEIRRTISVLPKLCSSKKRFKLGVIPYVRLALRLVLITILNVFMGSLSKIALKKTL